MFNMLQTPNDKQYPIGGCRTNFQVGGGPWPDASFSVGAASNHPGGANVLFARRQRPVHQGQRSTG